MKQKSRWATQGLPMSRPSSKTELPQYDSALKHVKVPDLS